MFEVQAVTLAALRMRLGTELENVPIDIRRQLTSSDDASTLAYGPFLQLSYDEIDTQEIDRLLGYADISNTNTPIGLDGDFHPRIIGTNAETHVLLFPLQELEEHLTKCEPATIRMLKDLGSMDAFVNERGEEMTAVEYLAAGIVACILFCKKNNQALTISW